MIAGINVAKVRTEMGRELARSTPVEVDIVVPVPDSGNYAALGFAEELGIPYSHAFVRNHYIGRTFLQPSQLIRDFNVRVKLNLIKEMVEGKRVVVVDDSIVRGTTARARVINLREAGAKEVHMRVSLPAASPCLPLRNRFSRSREAPGQPVHHGPDPRVSRGGFARLLGCRRNGARHGSSRAKLLFGLFYG
jgi:glutamine phosphoribosylpyrophosphate amidotransferase